MPREQKQYATIGGKEYDVQKLWERTSKRQATPADLEELKWILSKNVWGDYVKGRGTYSPEDVLAALEDDELTEQMKTDLRRVEEADLDYPIITYKGRSKRKRILDGVHRLVKALRNDGTLLEHTVSPSDLKSVGSVKSAQESARGIPDRSSYGSVEDLPVDKLMNYVVQEHDAARAGKHHDLRFGPDDMFSWAVPKGMPKPGQRRLAIQQPLHEGQYASFEGTIPEGEYGAGEVKTFDRGAVLVTHASPGKVNFVVTHRGTPERFTLIRTKDKDKDWILMNTTPVTSDVHKYHNKVHYKKIPEEEIDKVLDGSYAVSAKIDGAAALFHVLKDKIEAISYRTDKEGKPILHTHRIPGMTGLDIPKELQGTVLRGELYAQRNGKTLSPQEIGGLLNASVENSRRKQQRDRIKMKAAIFRVLKEKGKKANEPGEGYDIEHIRQIVSQLPSDVFTTPPTETDPVKARQLFEDIRAGKLPLTQEGIVATPREDGRPTKVKMLKEYDVPITGVFKAETKAGPERAGGFEYETEEGEKGRVGTGFSHATLQDMYQHPEKYVGRTARVRSQGKFPKSKALRAPAFISLHEDISQKESAADVTGSTDGRDTIRRSTGTIRSDGDEETAVVPDGYTDTEAEEISGSTSGATTTETGTKTLKPSEIIAKLKNVKDLSDKKQYRAKHARAMELINKYPDKFVIDSEGAGIVGVTHKPTGFRFHLPKSVLTGVSLKREVETPVLLNMTVSNGNEKKAEFLAEFAETSSAQRRGLGGRRMMPDDFGMLFKTATSFWMKRCNFDLDAVFLDKTGEVVDIQHMPRESFPKRFTARSDKAVSGLELPSGWCAANGIEVGDRIWPVN